MLYSAEFSWFFFYTEMVYLIMITVYTIHRGSYTSHASNYVITFIGFIKPIDWILCNEPCVFKGWNFSDELKPRTFWNRKLKARIFLIKSRVWLRKTQININTSNLYWVLDSIFSSIYNTFLHYSHQRWQIEIFQPTTVETIPHVFPYHIWCLYYLVTFFFLTTGANDFMSVHPAGCLEQNHLKRQIFAHHTQS